MDLPFYFPTKALKTEALCVLDTTKKLNKLEHEHIFDLSSVPLFKW